MGVDRDVWGPAFWTALHTASFAYPDHPDADQRRHMRAYIDAHASVLPCPDCREHFADMLRECGADYDRALAGRDALTRFLVDIHNRVNQRLGKPTKAYVEVAATYSAGGASSCPLYTRMATTAHGAYYCQTRPSVVWISLVCVALVVLALGLALAGRTVLRWRGVVRECQRKCPAVAARAAA